MARDAASDIHAMQHDLPAPDPVPSANTRDPLGDDALTDDALTGSYRIWQRRRGHRYSLDDVLTAYQAARITPAPQRYLDLGCGIGSVLLMVAYKHRDAHVTGIEAQAQSFTLATRNVQRNQQHARISLHHGDIRDRQLIDALQGPFDLITGTPPYQPPGAGTPSPDSQRAHARVELRGGVEVYLQAAARVLSAQGRLVVCGDARAPQRVIDTAAQLGFTIVDQCDAVPYADRKAPLFTVWTLAWSAQVPAQPWTRDTFYARNTDGSRTEAVRSVRRFFDLSINAHEAPSPPQRTTGTRE